MHAFRNDLRYTARSLRKSPVFTAVTVVTLGLAIAANAVVFAVVKTVLLNPLPYRDADRLVTLVEGGGRTAKPEGVSYATVEDWTRETTLFDRVAVWTDTAVRPIRDGRAEQLRGMQVSASFFETLGVPMLLGRSFRAEEDTPGRENVLVLTYETWMNHFGGDPGIVGRAVPAVDGPYTVVGVLRPDFRPLHMSNPAELPSMFRPMGWDADRRSQRGGGFHTLRAIGRLRAGVTSQQAQAELNALMRTLVRRYPDYPDDASAIVTPLRDDAIAGFGRALGLLEACALLLLVLACANVATLLFARGVGRRTEFAVRASLGADRATLVRQLLTECLLLSTAAAAAGVSLAWVATRLVARTGDPNIPRIAELAPDGSMLLVGIAAAVVTALLFGLVPSVMATAAGVASLRTGAQVLGRRLHDRTLRGIVAAEVALAFALLLVLGLLSRSYLRVMQVNPGYEDPRHLLTVSLLPDGVHYDTPARHLAYFDRIGDRVKGIPGVLGVGYASTLPLSHPRTTAFHVREHPLSNGANAPNLDQYLVSATYLQVMRIPVVRGRPFTPADNETGQRVAIVSQSAARTQFVGEDPIGQHVQIGERDDTRPWAVIVGVAGDVHQYGLDREADAAVYMPFAQVDPPVQGYASLVVRSAPPAERMESAVRSAMVAVDPLQPVFHMQPMTTYIALSVSQRTFALALVAAFGLLGFVLAIAGVYAVVSYSVEQRTREIGLRFALGATPGAVRRMVVRQVMTIASIGIACGIVASALLTGGLSALLFGVTRFDPGTTVATAVALVVAALAASCAPIARAARVAPMAALRSE